MKIVRYDTDMCDIVEDIDWMLLTRNHSENSDLVVKHSRASVEKQKALDPLLIFKPFVDFDMFKSMALEEGYRVTGTIDECAKVIATLDKPSKLEDCIDALFHSPNGLADYSETDEDFESMDDDDDEYEDEDYDEEDDDDDA